MQAVTGTGAESMKTFLTLVVLGGLLAVAVWFSAYILTDLRDVELSVHGVIALVAGTVVSLLVGIGLMTLVFVSARRGYDDEVNRP
jgi:cation transporter-like permease